jgi:hypothetical protein
MRRTLNVFLLAVAPALSFAVLNPAAVQSTPKTTANLVQPQANSQASSHDRRRHRNSTARRRHHHHKSSVKH